MNDAETLQRLRKRLCQTENLGTLRNLADEASELAGISEESLLGDVADFQDRIAAKIEALGGQPVPKRPKSILFIKLSGAVNVTDARRFRILPRKTRRMVFTVLPSFVTAAPAERGIRENLTTLIPEFVRDPSAADHLHLRRDAGAVVRYALFASAARSRVDPRCSFPQAIVRPLPGRPSNGPLHPWS